MNATTAGLVIAGLGALAGWWTLLRSIGRDGERTRERVAVIETKVDGLGRRVDALENRHPSRGR